MKGNYFSNYLYFFVFCVVNKPAIYMATVNMKIHLGEFE